MLYKFREILGAYGSLPPSIITSGKLKWQMTEETAVALLTEAAYTQSQAITIVKQDTYCLGIPVEIITKDEINLVIKVV